MTTVMNRGRCRQNANGLCNSTCLCQIFCPDINPEALMSPDPLEIDEIYQVLGRDILRSSLLDDIDLYLECDEDSLYVVPHETLPSNASHVAKSRLAARVRISFPPSCQKVSNERVGCTQCSRSFTRESLLKDHRFRCHGAKDLFPCTLCAYVGQRHRLLQKHVKRQHRDHVQQWPGLTGQQNVSRVGSAPDASPVSCTLPNTATADQTVCGSSEFSSTPMQGNVCDLSQPTDSHASLDTVSSCEILKHCRTQRARRRVTHTSKQSCTFVQTGGDIARNTKPGRKENVCTVDVTSDVFDQITNKCSDVFQCNKCDKVFKQRRSHSSHMKRHAGLLTHACSECNKHFPSRDTLRKHTGTHQAVRQYGCPREGCAKTFRTRYALKEHVTVVHGTKSWLCPHSGCAKAYATEKDLRAHAVAHTGTHTCTECGKTFRDSHNLTMHGYIHSGIKNMACTLCNYKCVQKSSLNWHIKKKHSDCEVDTVH